MSIPLPQTHHHPFPLQTLAPHLLPHLPSTLPLLRRLQFHNSSTTAKVLATFPPNLSCSPPSFSATYVDRTRAPETECWIFSTYELPQSHGSPSQPQVEQYEPSTQARAQLLALLYAISQLPNPNPNPNPLIIIGSFHECLLPLLGGSNLKPQKVLTRNLEDTTGISHPPTEEEEEEEGRVLNSISIPYTKWLIPPPAPSSKPPQPHTSQTALLPTGYKFSSVDPSELSLIISRTSIPRTIATLSKLGSVAIRSTTPPPQEEKGKGELIAWAFIGADGSLTSLHVELEHRGKGLAKAVGRKLFAKLAEDPEEMGFLPVNGERGEMGGWTHSDVAIENIESAGVVGSLSGREGWRVRWVSVDLRRVEGVVGGMGRGVLGR